MTTTTIALKVPDHAEYQSIDSKFCRLMEQIQTVKDLNDKVIDPGQHLYDYVHKTIKTREDYVLFTNAFFGCPSIDGLLSLQMSGPEQHAGLALLKFNTMLLNELHTLAVSSHLIKNTAELRKHITQQSNYLASRKYNTSVVDRQLDKMQMGWTGLVFTDLTVMAQYNGLTLLEYIGPITKFEQSALCSYVKTIFGYYLNNAARLYSSSLNKLSSQYSQDVFEHVSFLCDLYRDSVLLSGARKDIRRAIRSLANNQPTTVRSAVLSKRGHDTQADSELLFACTSTGKI